MKLWMSINVLDGILVNFTPMGWNVAQEVSDKAHKVATYDYEAMDMFDVDWQVKWNVGLYWLWAKVFPWWDGIDKRPICESIDPLCIIPDPHYQNAKDMRFIWFEQRENIFNLTEKDGYFWVQEIIDRKWEASGELDETRASQLNPNGYPVTIADDGMIDIYHHYMIIEWKKYLTSWVGHRKILVKIVEILPKNKSEKRDPRKIRFPVEFFRSNPVSWLFFGASFWDEIGQYADAETVLDNLELILARKIAMGDDKFINTSIVDIKTLQSKTPGGRLIPVKLEDNEDIRSSIFTVPQDNPWQLPQYASQKLRTRQEETTWMSDVAFWVSPQGDQTKAEIQTLQQNLNGILSYAITMLMRSEKRCWEIWYSYYVHNLHAKSIKFIAITRGWGVSNIFEFKKSDFIVDMPVMVNIKSKAQEKQKKERKFARFQVIMGTVLPNVQPWSYAFNEIMREYMSLGELEKDDILKFIPYTVDEIDAMEGLILLEWDEKPASPADWQDYDIFINYYSFAKDSDLKHEIMREYIDAKKNQARMALAGWAIPALAEWWKTDATAQWQMGNALIQEGANKTPSTQDLQA